TPPATITLLLINKHYISNNLISHNKLFRVSTLILLSIEVKCWLFMLNQQTTTIRYKACYKLYQLVAHFI
ncbi:MAG: hypothetical protein JSV32_06170, partial [Dehalococcoidia bacterium]